MSDPKLEKLMQDGWSYRVGGNATTASVIVDDSTGKTYKLHIVDGKLKMTEVSR